MTRRVLVTGANGFVGQVVWTTLVQAGLPVRAVVRSPNRVPASLHHSEVVCVGNIGPDTVWASAVSDVDTVVHLAGRVHVLKETAEAHTVSGPIFPTDTFPQDTGCSSRRVRIAEA